MATADYNCGYIYFQIIIIQPLSMITIFRIFFFFFAKKKFPNTSDIRIIWQFFIVYYLALRLLFYQCLNFITLHLFRRNKESRDFSRWWRLCIIQRERKNSCHFTALLLPSVVYRTMMNREGKSQGVITTIFYCCLQNFFTRLHWEFEMKAFSFLYFFRGENV